MSKGIYAGVNGSAPIDTTGTTTLTNSNLTSFFTVTSGTYSWNTSDESSGGVRLVPGNVGINSSTGQITLTAKSNLSNIIISGRYTTESNYDKITLTVAGTTVLSAVSGTSALVERWSGSLTSGQSIILTFTKDSSQSSETVDNTYFVITMTIPATTIDNLPSGYTRLCYIESTGTQYINTGFTPNNLSACEVMLSCTSVSDTANGCFGAAGANYTTNAFEFYYNGKVCNLGFGDTPFRYTSTISVNDILTVKISQKERTVLLNNTQLCSDIPAEETFTCPTTFITHALNRAGTIQYYSSTRLYSCKLWDNDTLIRNFVPCQNSSGTIGLYDAVNSKFYTNAGTGTFIAGPKFAIAKKVKKIFIGVSDKAHKVKKGYVGVNGIAKLFYTNSLKKLGTIAYLSEGRTELAAATTGNYALFGGGYGGGTSESALVDAYNKSFTRSNPTPLNTSRYWLSATNLQQYAIFGGGRHQSGTYIYISEVEAYNNSLTTTLLDDFATPKAGMAATTINNFALFSPGFRSNRVDPTSLDVYNSSLTHSILEHAIRASQGSAAASSKNYALIGGGEDYYSYYALQDVSGFDKSLTSVTVENLSVRKQHFAATAINDYIVFAGGIDVDDNNVNTIDVYNSSLTRTSPISLNPRELNLEKLVKF